MAYNQNYKCYKYARDINQGGLIGEGEQSYPEYLIITHARFFMIFRAVRIYYIALYIYLNDRNSQYLPYK